MKLTTVEVHAYTFKNTSYSLESQMSLLFYHLHIEAGRESWLEYLSMYIHFTLRAFVLLQILASKSKVGVWIWSQSSFSIWHILPHFYWETHLKLCQIKRNKIVNSNFLSRSILSLDGKRKKGVAYFNPATLLFIRVQWSIL